MGIRCLTSSHPLLIGVKKEKNVVASVGILLKFSIVNLKSCRCRTKQIANSRLSMFFVKVMNNFSKETILILSKHLQHCSCHFLVFNLVCLLEIHVVYYVVTEVLTGFS